MKKITIGTDFSGVGAFNQSLKRLGVPFEEVFACDMDKYARQTFCLNNGTEKDVELSKSKEHCKMCDDLLKYAGLKVPKAGSDEYLKYIEYGEALRAKSNELAKQYSFYYAFDVYAREIPADPLTIYVPTPPCQAFSLAGKRLGKEDRRGILFFNSLEFIDKNRPRYFMFENVKGLLSHDKDKNQKDIPGQENHGKTFREWKNFLGGKSVNGKETIFPYEDAVPYHIYYKVLNAKHYGVPQNRERIFIIGIRDDEDNNFHFPKPFPLKKRLKDVLESNVDEKYFLSQQMIDGFMRHAERHAERQNGFSFSPSDIEREARSITTNSGSRNTDNYIKEGFINQDTQASAVHNTDGVSQTLVAGPHGYANGYVLQQEDEINIAAIRGRGDKNTGIVQTLEIGDSETCNSLTTVEKDNVLLIKSNTEKGFEELTENDTLNYSNSNSKTRRGRVGKGIAQTLDTSCNQGVIVSGQLTEGMYAKTHEQSGRVYSEEGISPALHTMGGGGQHTKVETGYKIRRLTPLECFKLMDFNFGLSGINDFVWDVSDSQAYKQAGNSVPVNLFVKLVERLNFE